MPPEQTPSPQTEPFNFLETSPRRNFSPWFLIFCTILIVIGLTLAGYFKYQAYQTYQAMLSEQAESQREFEELKQERDSWQTYRNEEYGFEFKYPANWELISGDGEVELYAPESQGLDGPFVSADILIATATMTAGTLQGYVATYRDGWYSDYSCHVVGSGPETIRCTSQFLTIPRLPALAGFVRIDNERLALVVGTDSSVDTFSAVLRSIRSISSSPGVIENPVACTMDAMMCPDGSYVGRTGPKCEFVCP